MVWDLHGHLLSVKTTGWLAGGRAGGLAGGDGGVEQGELSLDVRLNVTAGWKKTADTQSGAVSRLVDCMIRAG